MMTMAASRAKGWTRTRFTSRVRRWRTLPNRWGDGKVHLLVWSKADQEWVFVCPRQHTNGTEEMHDDPPVTCRECLRSPLVPDDWRDGSTMSDPRGTETPPDRSRPGSSEEHEEN